MSLDSISLSPLWLYRNDNEIRGFKVLETENKIYPYADNTTLIIDGLESSFYRSLSLMDTLALISGLKVNCKKTEALWIGLYNYSETTAPFSKPILWEEDNIYVLGV